MDTRAQELIIEIRKRIKQIRFEKGYTQENMADMLNISQNAYYKLEKGYSRIDLCKFIKLSKILEVEVAELINGPNYKYVFSRYYKKDIIRKL
jgi:transcriptional regulator with XRE-family HTH domain